MPEIKSVVNTSLRDFNVLFYNVKSVNALFVNFEAFTRLKKVMVKWLNETTNIIR